MTARRFARRTGALVAFALTTLQAVSAARAGLPNLWMPTEAGSRWSFVGPLGARDSVIGRGPDQLDGVQAVRNEHVAGPDAGLQQFWSNTGPADTGDLLFVGFHRTGEDFGIRYEPPMRFMRGPALVGDNWIVNPTPIRLPDGTSDERFTMEFRVMEVIEPGFVGEAYGVSYSLIPPAFLQRGARTYSPFGNLLPHDAVASGIPPDEPLDWFAVGYGQVRYRHGGGLFVLESYESPVPVENSTWGRIKRLYR